MPGGVGTFNSATNYATGRVFYTYMAGPVTSKVRAVNGRTGEVMWESNSMNITTASPMHSMGQLVQGITQGGTVLRAHNPITEK